jgi:hypothetical protein
MLRTATILGLACLAGCGGSPSEPTHQAAADPAFLTQTAVAATTMSSPAAAPARPATGPRKPLPPGVVMLEKVIVADPGIIKPGPALAVLVPAGWRGSGGVVANRDPCGEPFGVQWSAASPDGRSTLGIVPTETWQWSNTLGSGQCQQGSFATVRDYLAARVQRDVPGARILDFRDRADFARSANEAAQARMQMARQAGITTLRAKAEGGEMLFAYDRDGVAMRGVMGATAVFYLSELPNPMGGEPLRTLIGSTLGTFTASAPDGQLDFELLEASRRSVTPDPGWADALMALKTRLGGIAAQGTAERASIIVAGGAAATKANIEAYRRMAQPPPSSGGSGGGGTSGGSGGELYPGESTSDRMQRESIEAVRGVETYHDPVDNRAVQLDHNYDHAWRVTNQDAYILTKDPNFNPGQYGIEATQMGVVR